MTDKEIIIDGVDVSGCQFRDNPYFSPCGGCENDDNCYYKQLQRKTAECEKLIQIINKSAERFCTDYLDTIKENEILKDELSAIQHNCNRSGCKYYDDNTFKVFYDCKAKTKAEKYEQALNEIVKLIKDLENENILTFPDFSKEENYKMIMGQCNQGYVDILNIISKAKDGKNE